MDLTILSTSIGNHNRRNGLDRFCEVHRSNDESEHEQSDAARRYRGGERAAGHAGDYQVWSMACFEVDKGMDV